MNQTIRNLLLLYPRGGFKVTDVPQSEGDALIWLYKATNGPSWTNHTNWLQTHTVGNWFGVTVAGGHVTQVQVSNNNLVGNVGGFPIANLPLMQRLYLNANAVLGDISSWTLPAPMVALLLHGTGLSGNTSGWVLPAPQQYLQLNNTSLSGTPDISGNTAMGTYNYYDCALSQANVDAVLLSIYNRRASFTNATPDLLIAGTNAAPSGVYADEDPPVTGKGMAFELVNDPEAEGFNVWTVGFTP